ncbi:hypothetical protein Ocin01_15736 [Orchesella cincta]|uniref:Uncharacterized protein n=1 Tax=Orchesella cincta TaxID=48709 RepID=A0A1D2MD87_ORCCI|nr:hypothetical protein Ocin01_15736 [Orchesella cincta]
MKIFYSREDMSQYDFALETPEERRRKKAKEEHDKRRGKNKENCIDGFRISSSAKLKRKHYSAPTRKFRTLSYFQEI